MIDGSYPDQEGFNIMRRSLWVVLSIWAVAAGSARADTALIIGNSRYETAWSIRAADEVLDAVPALEATGFSVLSGEDLETSAIRERLSALLAAGESQRVVIALAGHFAYSGDGETWFLGREADAPDLATAGAEGVALSTVLRIAAGAPGRAVVLLGTEDRRIALGNGLAPGIGRIDPPQGVTVITGQAGDIAEFLGDGLTEPGVSLPEMLERAADLTPTGFLSPSIIFLDPPEEEGSAAPEGPDPDEAALWAAASELDTLASYRAYLAEYPRGPNAAEARARIAAIRSEPGRQARLAEEALSLSRAERREVQRDLTVLGFDTRGIDGIFGPGTRGAIGDWQRGLGFEVTGYLDAAQIARLSQMADDRAADLERQAAEEAAARDRADRAYWQALGQGADEAGLRAYLERYPDGLFADVARARLEDIDAAAHAEAEARERADWDAARAADTVAAYRDFLDAHPDGDFARAAEARIDELTDGISDPDLRAELRAREDALGLNTVTRQLIERRLAGLGLEPGRVDGAFDADTRRALRGYQRARNLQVTGFVDQPTLVRLMAETVGIILR